MSFFTQIALGCLIALLLGLAVGVVALITWRSRSIQQARQRDAIWLEYHNKVTARLQELHGAEISVANAVQALTPNGRQETEALKDALVNLYAETSSSDDQGRLAQLYQATGMMAHDSRVIYEGSLEERSRATYRLGRMQCRAAMEALTTVTRVRSNDLRLVATWALTETGDPRAVQPVITSLADADGWQLMQAANCLLGMNVDLTLPLLELLGAAGAKRERRERTAAAILDLISDFGQRARSRLNLHACRHAAGELIRSGSVDIRTRAIRALSALGVETSQDVERIVRALQDNAWEVRAVAARALGELNLSEAIPQLYLAVSDQAWWVRHNAAHALQRLGESGCDALRKLQVSEDRFAREMAVQALSQGTSETRSLISGFR